VKQIGKDKAKQLQKLNKMEYLKDNLSLNLYIKLVTISYTVNRKVDELEKWQCKERKNYTVLPYIRIKLELVEQNRTSNTYMPKINEK
jgi:hypothetical protein